MAANHRRRVLQREQDAARGQALGRVVQDVVDSVDRALAKNPLPQSIRVSRGVSVRAFGVDRVEDLPGLVGTMLTEPGFLSTSIDELPPAAFTAAADDVILQLGVSAGTPALFVQSLSGMPAERELLIARGQRIDILSARYDGGLDRWIVCGYVYPPEES